MFKTLTTLVLAVMMMASASTAFAETTTFTLSVVLPQVASFDRNMNMPAPPQAGISQQRDLPKNIQQQTIVRNNKEVVVASAVVL